MTFSVPSDALVQAARALIQIPSLQADPAPGQPFGPAVDDALQYMLSLARSLGFSRVENVDGYAGFVEIGQGEEELAVLVHLDVVPAGQGWSVGPFSGDIRDGYLYGRGAVDDKGPAVAALFALKILMDAGVPFHRRIRLIFGLNEESGNACIDHYLSVQPLPHLAFSPDADYPLINTEKGILHIRFTSSSFSPDAGPGVRVRALHAGERPNVVPAAASAQLDTNDPAALQNAVNAYQHRTGHAVTLSETPAGFLLQAHGKGAHASMPEQGVNAACILLDCLASLPLAPQASSDAIRALQQAIVFDLHGQSMHIDTQDAVSGRLTCNLGLLATIDQAFSFTLDIRYPVSLDSASLADHLARFWKTRGFTASVLEDSPGHYVPADHPLVQTLLRVYTEQTGLPGQCIAIGGGTYARKLPGRAVAFGPVFPGMEARMHMADERIAIDHLIRQCQITAQACYALACQS